MKHCLLLALVLWISPLHAQDSSGVKDEPYRREWRQIDSLLGQRLPASAYKIIVEVYNKAYKNHQQMAALKAQLYYFRTVGFHDGEDTVRIREARILLKKATGTERLIWHSILAQLYFEYYLRHSWELSSRTALATTVSDNLKEWDADQFMSAIAKHCQRSLDVGAIDVPIGDYAAILDSGANARYLRPTLYDLLAFRAIQCLRAGNDNVTSAALSFQMDDPALLAPVSAFIHAPLNIKDSLSSQWQTLRIYRQLLKLHMNDRQPDAFIDADLQRIEFVYLNAAFADKRKRYEEALKHIVVTYPENATAAEASYRLLALQLDVEDPQPGKQGPDRPAIKRQLGELLKKFPKTEAGIHAWQLIQTIEQRSLSIVAEETTLPDVPGRVLVRYRNVPNAWFRVVKIDPQWQREQEYDRMGMFDSILLKLPAMLSFRSSLPGSEDYEPHSTEVKIDALPPGAYAVIVSANSTFSTDNNAVGKAIFQVTNLSLVKTQGNQQHQDGFILHRGSGKPLADVGIIFFRQEYNSQQGRYIYTDAPEIRSSRDGSFYINIGTTYAGYRLHYGDDNYYEQSSFFSGAYLPARTDSVTHTFFFTDRSIYRPGQTIYFKGIMVKTEAGGKESHVVAHEKTSVVLINANRAVAGTGAFTTNEFGSFSGSFIIPQDGITGTMVLSDGHDGQTISVEEYKRPKFRVSFDTLKAYRLNEQVRVSGSAVGYAGNNVDNATVIYTVRREARWPFWYDWWRPMPESNQREIAHGVTTTDANGAFNVPFVTLADPGIDSASLPVFTYSIHVDITDNAGETRSGDQSLSVGYRRLQLSADIPATANARTLEMLHISTTNLNGQFVPATVSVKVAKLMAPAHMPRKRLWESPDRYVMDEATFHKYFPADEYKDEGRPQSWAAGDEVWQHAFITANNGELSLPTGIIKTNGWYRIIVKATDADGQVIRQRYYVQVYDPILPGSVLTDFTVFGAQKGIAPGSVAAIDVVSSFEDLHLLQVVNDMSKVAQFSRADAKDGVYHWSRAVTEADRGGLLLRWLAVKNNRMYTEEITVPVPWSNKQLLVSWESHRDKLEPGAKETWTMQVRGNKKEKFAAELLAGMYDGSLDAFKEHAWAIPALWPSVTGEGNLTSYRGFSVSPEMQVSTFPQAHLSDYDKQYDQIIGFAQWYGTSLYQTYRWGNYSRSGMRNDPDERYVGKPDTIEVEDPITGHVAQTISRRDYDYDRAPVRKEAVKAKEPLVALRKNLQETAFFLPQLKTDTEGNVKFEFTMPEALTEWKFMALAHTKDLQMGQLTGTVKTQKDLMVQPNLPRFLRQGDELTIVATISNLSGAALSGKATINFVDAQTLQPLNLPFGLKKNTVPFSVSSGGGTTASWKIRVPESRYEPVIIRITAQAGSFTDGEENTLPLLTNRTLVTETMPLWMNGSGTKSFRFDKLLHSDTSKTLSQYRLTLEYTANPAWNAIQALPYLMEFPYECAEQTFNRYYANALAAHILTTAPRVRAVFAKWEADSNTALVSNLSKNPELKSALLAETPWVAATKNETEQKRNIALLFNSYKLGKSQDAALKKLEDMRVPGAGFPWFKGCGSDRYISQYIATGIARLQHLGVQDSRADALLNSIMPYLDRTITQDYDQLLLAKARMDAAQINYQQIQYLYLKSFHKNTLPNTAAFKYYKQQAAKFWPKENAYIKGMIAVALNRMGDKVNSNNVLQSLKETAINNEESGTYWMEPGYGYWWYEAPVEAQSLLIECFNEAGDTRMTDDLKRWLLKQKQTQSWSTTKATADACYALLLTGSKWLNDEQQVSIKVGDKTIAPATTEAGTGYFKQAFTSDEMQSTMGNITLSVGNPSSSPQTTKSSNQPSYGAVYWQYFERYDKITPAVTPLALRKQLFIERNTDRGPVLEEIKAGNELKVGDKVKVRIVLQSDRDMEYLHLKDMRAACFEPTNVLSGYRYQGGLGYYESTRDASSNFFISYLNKGTYVFEYSVNVMAKGTFSNGISTIQCMYAPEFSSHSEGIQVIVK